MDGSNVQKRRKRAFMEENSGEGHDLINQLPDDCITKIFSFLLSSCDRCSCAAVSKKWLHLQANMRNCDSRSLSDSPPQTFSRRLGGRQANDIRLAALVVGTSPRSTLTHLSIIGMNPSFSSAHTHRIGFTDYGLEIIAKASPYLKSLTLWDCTSVGDKGFKSVGERCRDLKTLEVINLPLLTDDGLISIANNCSNLSTLSLESCPCIGSQSFDAFAIKSLKLNSVSLVKCPLVGDPGIISVVSNLPELATMKLVAIKVGDSILKAFREHGKALRSLYLEKIKGPSQTGYSRIGEMMELKSLTLRSCTGLTGESFKATTENRFAGLKEANIKRCGSLIDEVLIRLSKSAKLLKSLRLEDCGGFTSGGLMEALANWRQTLKVLSLTKCNITGKQELKQGDAHPLPEHYPSLTTLELKQCGGVEDCLLTWMGLACNRVKNVSLVGLCSITDRGLLSLLIYLMSDPNNLKSLDLSGCTRISEQALYAVMKAFGLGLKSLKLGACSGLSNGIMAMIADYCIALEDLSVAGCRISDDGMWRLLSAGQESLQILSLVGCAGITDRSLGFLEDLMCQNLVGLDLRNCSRLSRRGIDSVRTMLWWCEVIY